MIAKKNPRSIGTHDGTFHADEVTACALLLLFNLIDRDKIIRTRNPDVLATCEYVCDVGGLYDPSQKIFDHHQTDYDGKMSSAGMILLYLRDIEIISPGEYEFLHKNLILGVDDHDNGRDPQIPGVCTYSHVIANYPPYDDTSTDETQNAAFQEALDFALGLLGRFHKRYHYMQASRKTVEQAMEEGNECLYFDRYLPWLDVFFELGGVDHPALFVIMPSGDHWKLRGIPPDTKDKMKVRLALPQEWAGLMDDELKKVSGIPGAVFCHKGRFISVWETKEDAIQALEQVLSKEKHGHNL